MSNDIEYQRMKWKPYRAHMRQTLKNIDKSLSALESEKARLLKLKNKLLDLTGRN